MNISSKEIITSLEQQNIPDIRERPDFNVEFSGEKTSEYLMLIPVINEGEKILKQLRGIKEAAFNLDLLLVDGGSNDGSMEPGNLKNLAVNTLITKTGAGKLSAQLRIGFAWALYKGYKGVITIDGNGKDDFHAIPQFAAKLAENYDEVQGSRYLKGGVAENTPLDRELAVKFIHAPLISLAAGFRYTDTTNGFRAYSAKFLSGAGVQPFRNIFSTYNLHYYLAVRAPRLGYKVCEIAVTRKYPATGPVPSKIGGISGKLHILKQTISAALGAYNPK
jgi:dolichol-phosphate mannosyltransferase